MSAARRKVLIVDDDVSYGKMMVALLKVLGYEAILSNHFDDAIEAFRRHRPSVVLLDYNMPLVSGDKFLPLLQQMDPMVRVLVVSGCDETEITESFQGMGYFGFIAKGSLSAESLKEKLNEAFSS